jgi:hypothetical protein
MAMTPTIGAVASHGYGRGAAATPHLPLLRRS